MQIIFEYDHNGIIFRDALNLPDNHTYTDDELEAMKQTRISNWLTAITAPPPEYKRDQDGNIMHDEDGNPIPAE
jgi:hypothetical protein